MWRAATAAAVLTSFSVFACGYPTSTRGGPRSASVEAKTPTPMRSDKENDEMSFEQVLRIARSKTAEAKAQLEQVRSQESDDPRISMLARRILNRWDDKSNTYYSKIPQLLEGTCIDTEKLREMYPGEVEAKRVYLEIWIDATGTPVRASVIGGTDSKQLKEALVRSLMQRRYAPAKENDTYVDASLTVECRLEVR